MHLLEQNADMKQDIPEVHTFCHLLQLGNGTNLN